MMTNELQGCKGCGATGCGGTCCTLDEHTPTVQRVVCELCGDSVPLAEADFYANHDIFACRDAAACNKRSDWESRRCMSCGEPSLQDIDVWGCHNCK